MSWGSGPPTVAVGDVVTAATANLWRDLFNETAPAKVTTAGDIVVGTGSHAIDRLGKGADGTVLGVVAGAVAWMSGPAPGAHAATHQPGGSDPLAVDAAAGTGSLRTIGAGALQAAAGNHTHATGAPSAHAASHANGGSDPLQASGIVSSMLAANNINGDRLADNTVDGGKLTNSGVTAGIYGIGGNFKTKVTVDAKGRVTDIVAEAVTAMGASSEIQMGTGGGGALKVGNPTGGLPGGGGINTVGDIFKNGTQYNNPDYALEHAFTGRVARFADREGAAGYPGLRPLDEVEAFARARFQLPNVARANAERGDPDAGTGAFVRADVLLEMVEEVYLRLFEASRQLRALGAPGL